MATQTGLMQRLASALGVRRKAHPLGENITDPWDLVWGREPSAIPQHVTDYYRTLVGVYAAIKLRADNVARAPLVVYQDGAEGPEPVQPSHPLQVLLNRVNSFWGRGKLWRYTETSLCIGGSAFWALDSPTPTGQPTEIWWTRHDRMRIVPDATNYIKGYLYRAPTGKDIAFEPHEVLWMAYENPYDEFSGLSPLEAARLSVEANAEALAWNRRFFQNDATPGRTYLKMPKEVSLTPEQAAELQERWAKAYKGQGSHRMAVLDAGAELATLGLGQRDMEFIQLQKMTLQDISRIYRVPPPLIGDLENATLANVREYRAMLWHETIIPELQMFEETITEFLCPRFGEGLTVAFDLSKVEALQEQESAKVDRAYKLWSMGVPLNQLIGTTLADIGLEPVPWGDVWWAPLTLSPATSGGPSNGDEGKMLVAGKAIEYTVQETGIMAAWMKRLDRREGRMLSFFRGYFTEQEQATLKRLREQKRDALREDVFPLAAEAERLRKLGLPIIAALLQEEAEAAIEQWGLAIRFDLANPRVQQWLGNRVKLFSRDINQTTAEAIAAQLREGEAAGESIADLAKRIEGVFADARGYRAERIARTETLSASNRGAHEAYVQSGVVSQKRWLTAIDGRERPWHADAHGQVRGLDDAFDVGGESIMHPGEGSAANSINCRCAEQPIVGRSYDARCPKCDKLLLKGATAQAERYCSRCKMARIC